MRPHIKITQWRQWQGEETKARSSARFKVSLDATVKKLEYELERIEATDIEVAVGLEGRFSLKGNGWPFAGSTGHPGVVLTYAHPKFGVMRIATDEFWDWTDNLRGIAMTLEALRMMDRYGTTGNGRQYEGFRAIPASTGNTMTAGEAAVLIKEASKVKYDAERILDVRELAEIAVRAAIFNSHPDRNPGKPDATEYFHTVERARQALSAHHGGGL